MTEEITYVIGHKNPDTDSICSAIAFTELKKAEGIKNVEAARAGDINPQTSFILDYFKVAPPTYLPNVFPQAQDIMSRNIITVEKKTPLIEVMEIFKNKNVRHIPVVNEDLIPDGVLTPMDMAYMNIAMLEEKVSRVVFTSLANIVATLDADIHVDLLGYSERNFSVYIGAMEEASFLKTLGEKDPRKCIVIVGDRVNIQHIAVQKKISLLIVTGGLYVCDDIKEDAKKNGVSIITSPYDSATTAQLVRLSAPAYKLCNKNFAQASPDDLVEDIKNRIANIESRGIAVIGEDKNILGIITKSDILKPSQKSLILVDHNEISHAVDGADTVEIKEVVDHHRIANFHTSRPITFTCEPVGSSSTLIAEKFMYKSLTIQKKVAGLLLAGVLSDTVILKSPTTTTRDIKIAEWLEEKSGINYITFGREIFNATSSIKNQGPYKVVNGDYKLFEIKGKKLGIGQVETIGFDEFYNEKDNLMKELAKIKDKKGLELSSLLITDIVKETSLLLTVGDNKIISNFDYPKIEDNVYELNNVLSRKKQVVPHLINLCNEIY